MVKRQQIRLAVAGGALLVVALYFWLRPSAPAAPTTPAATGGRRGAAERDTRLPLIGLERLEKPKTEAREVARDLFAFGADPTPPPTVAPPVVAREEFPTPDTNLPPTPPPLPPLNVKYIGSLQTQKGLRVAFFQTEKKEIVTGQVGEVVMNRFKVMKIGIESADVQEVGVEQVRRLPLRGGS